MKKLKILLVLSLMLVLLAFLSTIGESQCTTFNAGKDATVDGSVIICHAQEWHCDGRIKIVPGQTFEKGTMVPVYKNLAFDTIPGYPPIIKMGEIPQAEKTYTSFHLGPFTGMNENQVFIGDEGQSARPELINPNGLFYVEQLITLTLQRAKTARDAIQIAGSLAEKYGYCDETVEAWAISDPNETWWFEIYGGGVDWTPDCGRPGALWVAQRVPDDHVSFNLNTSRIGEIDLNNPDYFMASPNVFSLGEEMGWYDPKSGKPFIFYEVYCPHRNAIPNLREWRIASLIAPSQNFDPSTVNFPFSIKPDKKLSLQDLMEIQRDVYQGTKWDLTKGLDAGPFGSPDRWTTKKFKPEGSYGWPRSLSQFPNTYTYASQSRSWLPNPIGGLMWFGYDQTITTCHVPFYCGITKVPESFSQGRRDIFDKTSAYWAFDFVSNWANLKWSYMIEDIREARKYLEDDMFAMQPAIEAAALELYKKDPSLAEKFLTNYSNDTANRVVDYWWDLGDKLVAKYTDGYVLTPEGRISVDYPEWWLKAVGFGQNTIAPK